MNMKNNFSTSKALATGGILILFSMLAITSCRAAITKELLPTNPLSDQVQPSTESSLLSDAGTITITPSPSPDVTELSPTRTPGMFNMVPIATVAVTQIPIQITSPLTSPGDYLYKDVVVLLTFKVLNSDISKSYLNLDDLNENTTQNSDIEVDVDFDKMTTFSIIPVNEATDFVPRERALEDKTFSIPDKDLIDYSYCVEQLSDYANYWGMQLGYGEPICVRTNENRIAIVQYFENSIVYNDDGTMNLSLKVTVYKEPLAIQQFSTPPGKPHYKHFIPGSSLIRLEFDYPETWIVRDDLEDKKSTMGLLGFIDPRYLGVPTQSPNETISRAEDTGTVLIESRLRSETDTLISTIKNYSAGCRNDAWTQLIGVYQGEIDHHDATIIECQVQPNEDYSTIMIKKTYIFEANDRIYLIIFTIAENRRGDEFESGFEELIKSIKVVE